MLCCGCEGGSVQGRREKTEEKTEEKKRTKKQTKKKQKNKRKKRQREQKQKYLQDDSVITIVDCGAGWHERVRGLGIRGVGGLGGLGLLWVEDQLAPFVKSIADLGEEVLSRLLLPGALEIRLMKHEIYEVGNRAQGEV